MSLLSPSKVAFQYSPAREIVHHIMLIASSNLCMLFRMRYEHEAIQIALSLYTFQTNPMESGINQRKRHHRTSYRLNTADA